MNQTIGSVADRLRVNPERLAALDVLPESDLVRFEATVAKALEANDRAFDSALEHALRIVPRPLRGAARTLLFPRGTDE